LIPKQFSIPDILRGDVTQLGQLFAAAAAPESPTSLRLQFADKLFSQLFAGDLLEQSLNEQLSPLRASWVEQIAADDSFYTAPNHPLRLLFDYLGQQASHWYPRDNKASQQFQEKFNALVQGEPNTCSARLASFQQWHQGEEKRASMLEARLCEAELSHLKTLTAECKALDLLNSALADTSLPADLTSGLLQLKSELMHCLLIGGNDSPFWKTWQRLLPLLGQVFTSGKQDEQLIYRNVPILLNELERSLTLTTSNPESYQLWVAALCEHLIALVKKQTQERRVFSPLPYPDGHSKLDTRVTQAVLQQGAHLQQGDWILFNGEQGQIRCKLALKNPDVDQLLFVDNNGRKVMTKSPRELALCFSTGIAKPLPTLQLQDVIARLLQELRETQQLNQTKRQVEAENLKLKAKVVAELEQKLELQKQVKARAQQQRQLMAENAARRAAAQKAMTEARALADEKVRRQAEQLLEQERERERQAQLQLEQDRERERQQAAEAAEQLQRVQMANIQISALNLGARVELLVNGEAVQCKLAVIIAAAGKYIFVNNLGRKVAELHRDQMLQALLDKQLTLLNNGDSFDDQLAKVIRGLRKDVT
jgi:hypothetical protein